MDKHAHGVLVLIAYAQKSPINANTGVSRGHKSLNLGLSLQLHSHFVCASSVGSGESAQQRRLAGAIVALQSNKYQNRSC